MWLAPVTRHDGRRLVKVTVDQDKCVSSGHVRDERRRRCSTSATTTASSSCSIDEPGPDHADETRKAAAACPALAIHIEE